MIRIFLNPGDGNPRNESTGRDVKDVETPVFFVVSVACKSLGHQSKYQ